MELNLSYTYVVWDDDIQTSKRTSMKWHRVINTIAAACLCTLPFPSNGAHCDAQTWNDTLKLQQQADQIYNYHAQRFNQLLQHHSLQPLLHQEFSRSELATLWKNGQHASKQRMEMQIEASQHIVQSINEELKSIHQLNAEVIDLSEIWQHISQHCQADKLTTNVVASYRYYQSNLELTRNIYELLNKLKLVQQSYQTEINTLLKAQ